MRSTADEVADMERAARARLRPIIAQINEMIRADIAQRCVDLVPYPHVYHWHRCGRKGQLCRVTARGKMNSCRVEFQDGFVMITSRNALRKAAR